MSSAILGVVFTESAQAIDFKFQFTNTNGGSGSAIVEGFVRGLTEGEETGATSVEVTRNDDGFGLGEYVNDPQLSPSNTWTVQNGVITGFSFRSFGAANSAPNVTDSSLFLASSTQATPGEVVAGLSADPSIAVVSTTSGLTFKPVVSETEPVPEPVSLLGIAAIGAVVAGGTLTKRSA